MFLQRASRSFVMSNVLLQNSIITLGGAALLAILSQIAIPLPFTPVPITGQTLGVALLALTLGRSKGLSAVVLYLLAGAAGLPVFAQAQSGLVFGPTIGYLIGMLLATVVMGSLADSGWTLSFKRTLAAAFMGTGLTLVIGVVGLSFFLPAKTLLIAGVLPFLPGAIIKDTLAATLAYKARSAVSK
jgi:biotin transport system substrate-specific component